MTVLAGCASGQQSGRADLLDFIQDGRTTRDQVLIRLGIPSSTYERDRILAYRVRKSSGGYELLGRQEASWAGVHYDLMLAFDGDGLLRQHALVEVRSP